MSTSEFAEQRSASERDPQQPRDVQSRRTTLDRAYRGLSMGAGMATLVILFLIGLFLLLRAIPALREAGTSFITTFEWNTRDPADPDFGIGAIMYWTVVISLIALVIAVPVSLVTGLFITEYAPRRVRRFLTTLVDLFAAIPSIIYGIWGFFFLQPRMLGISQWLDNHLDFIPIFDVDRPQFGSSALIAGVVVSLMVLPICTSVIREVFSQAPPSEKEGALALGGTRWGMIRSVVLPFGRGGIVGGSMLGLGRALGETIAIAIIVNPSFEVTAPINESGANSTASHIALRFGEANDLELSALMAAGLALFILTLFVNTFASIIVNRSRSGKGVEI